MAGDWLARRQTLAALGVPDIDRLDDILAEATAKAQPPVTDRAARSAEIAAFVAATGG